MGVRWCCSVKSCVSFLLSFFTCFEILGIATFSGFLSPASYILAEMSCRTLRDYFHRSHRSHIYPRRQCCVNLMRGMRGTFRLIQTLTVSLNGEKTQKIWEECRWCGFEDYKACSTGTVWRRRKWWWWRREERVVEEGCANSATPLSNTSDREVQATVGLWCRCRQLISVHWEEDWT